MRASSALGELLACGDGDSPVLLRLRAQAVVEIRWVLEQAPTLDAAAAELGITRSTLWRWRERYREIGE